MLLALPLMCGSKILELSWVFIPLIFFKEDDCSLTDLLGGNRLFLRLSMAVLPICFSAALCKAFLNGFMLPNRINNHIVYLN